jgi:hypothetical protein
VGAALLYLGAALCAAAIPAREGARELLLGAGNLLIGASAAVSGAPQGGAIPLVLGVLLLWMWWNRRGGKKRAREALGEKSRALRDALVRVMRERAVPVPA